jgi:hypothetical protein
MGKGAQVRAASPVKLPRRRFLHLAAGAAGSAAFRPSAGLGIACFFDPCVFSPPLVNLHAGGTPDRYLKIVRQRVKKDFFGSQPGWDVASNDWTTDHDFGHRRYQNSRRINSSGLAVT